MCPGFGWMGGWMGGPFMMIFMALFWGLIIYFALKLFRGGSAACSRDNRPMETLKERYAKGEITKEEFDQMKKTIE